MFVLSKLEADVRVSPQDLIKPPLTAVTEVLEKDYLDRVIPELGLVVTIYDVLSVEGGHIYPNDGAAYFRVVFRLVVFRPFAGEVLVGKIVSCSKKGVRVGIEFFDDIHVPDYALQDPSLFDSSEGLWRWAYEGNDMFMDLQAAPTSSASSCPAWCPALRTWRFCLVWTPTSDEPALGTAGRPYCPMEVTGDMCGDGLGLTSWWEAAAEDGAEEMDDGEG
ncbi:DNA-directed RNA polymerase III subunitC25 [Monoraphidium neglectum]|uniref:DNA-directed RNA polymerase III subunitC25 n=1 Tax=Monoraphidium neglectum TaxID=145388 RepID=A0A0D2JWM3_9CHLO|nr:DNA-directed RNA polymerase III subunitC25 [Monoraphidium neglectum]KIZ03093.1 DNA-directed RNA polymerase III subunitC25 [Monoraphidium neglectum]|eukprot:XP_013902112.1 DNA-directed RNA polymerase III subunitC25 [Monoraphidium neglectum]